MSKEINVAKENAELAEIISGYKANLFTESYSHDLDFSKKFMEIAEGDDEVELEPKDELDMITGILNPVGVRESDEDPETTEDVKRAVMAIKKIATRYMKTDAMKEKLMSFVDMLQGKEEE